MAMGTPTRRGRLLCLPPTSVRSSRPPSTRRPHHRPGRPFSGRSSSGPREADLQPPRRLPALPLRLRPLRRPPWSFPEAAPARPPTPTWGCWCTAGCTRAPAARAYPRPCTWPRGRVSTTWPGGCAATPAEGAWPTRPMPTG